MRGRSAAAHDALMTDTQQHSGGRPSTAELIALGRDREAVDAATRDSEDSDRGGPVDGVQQLDQIIPMLEEIVDRIRLDQLDAPTPCAGFTVASVLEHMIGGATAFAPAFRGEDAPAASGADGETTDRWRMALADLLDAVHAPGAQERTLTTPFGEMPGSVFARYVAFDGLVHGWDLATATGQPYRPPADVVAEVDAFARDLLKPEMRDGDTFAAETEAPAGATHMERLVAFSGRRVPSTEAHA